MEIAEILTKFKKVAVLGISPQEDRDSYRVAKYLAENGFQVTGVRPGTKEIDGIVCVPSIADLSEPVEILDVFRAPEHIPQIVEEAIQKKVKVLWLQLGITHPEAEKRASDSGIVVVSDHCMKLEHKRVLNHS